MRMGGLIIGAGITGSAIAYELTKRGVTDLQIVDPDLEGSLSATERNAGGVRHLWQQPVNVELSRATISLIDKLGDRVGFQRTGYLWLYSHEKRELGEKMHAHTAKMGLCYDELSPSEIQKKAPFLDKLGNVAFGLFGKKDGLINSNALKTFFRDEARKKGARFHDRAWVKKIDGSKTTAEVTRLPDQGSAEAHLKNPDAADKLPSELWQADFIVIAADAWSKELLKGLVDDPHVIPYRRQICLFAAEGFNMSGSGMVVDTSGVYFHPEGGNILAGYVVKEEKPGFQFELDPQFFETYIWPNLYERSTQLERLKPITGWGGLYSYTPDTSGILGLIEGTKGIYEAHSFTGRGVMQSYGAALAISDLILDGKFTTLDGSLLTRRRFTQNDASQLLPEALHI